ncbi:MAG TPA: leucyl aminopeptidase [Candidatus Limnocylindria bacterium]|nr:leucyl aminopeptidase [Candidatus Limnocylindria bacterium]
MHFRTSPEPDLDALDALILPVYKDAEAPPGLGSDVRELAEWVARESGPQKLFTAVTHLHRAKDSATRLVIVAAGRREDYDVERARQAVSAGVRALWRSTTTQLGVVLDLEALDLETATQAAVEGVINGLWRPTTHRTGEEELQPPPLEDVHLIAPDDAPTAVARGRAVGEAVNWARSMANEPSNLLTPSLLAERVGELAKAAGLQYEVLDEEQCRALGMNTFLSVARGSDEPARFIVLRHHGRAAEGGAAEGGAAGDGYDLALVGKGITFDSGGISIKPAEDMHVMKYDMSGAAAVVAAINAIAQLGLPLNVLAVAPCTENLPGGHATKPGDVITSLSGKTVEVINTDAEGRLVLIDAVTYAESEGAARIVDVATLTGAIRIALGSYYTGLFGRPDSFVAAVRRAGEQAGERLWPMPLSDEFRDEMKSEVADLRNSAGRPGSASKGAAFIEAGLSPEVEWAHLDIAGSAWLEEERPFSPKGPQGTPVRTLVSLAESLAAKQ